MTQEGREALLKVGTEAKKCFMCVLFSITEQRRNTQVRLIKVAWEVLADS